MRKIKAVLIIIMLGFVVCHKENTGWIEVFSEPEGAVVFLDDSSTGKVTPCVLGDVEEGEHYIKLTKEGYEDWEKEVVVEAGDTVYVEAVLVPLTGTVVVNFTPTGAKVYLDGEDTGDTTNCVLDSVPVGVHTIKLVKEGYADWEQQIGVNAGEATTVNAILSSIMGKIVVTSTPTGARAYLDGVDTGDTTNCTLDNVPAGTHKIRLEKEGYKDWVKEFVLDPGEVEMINAVLEIATGCIQVNSEPEGADVWLDGEKTGYKTNCLLEDIPVGTHVIKLTKENYLTWEKEIEVTPDDTVIINAVLTSEVGYVKIYSEPEGAMVFLDGINTGKTTNCVLDSVPVGKHLITLKKEDYFDWEKEIEVIKDDTVFIDAELIHKVVVIHQDFTNDGTIDIRVDNGIMWLEVYGDIEMEYGISKGTFVNKGGISGEPSLLLYQSRTTCVNRTGKQLVAEEREIEIIEAEDSVVRIRIQEIDTADTDCRLRFTCELILRFQKEYAWFEYVLENIGSSEVILDEPTTYIQQGAGLENIHPFFKYDIELYISGVGDINITSLRWWRAYSISSTKPYIIFHRPSNEQSITFGYKKWSHVVNQAMAYYTGASERINPYVILSANAPDGIRLSPGDRMEYEGLIAFHGGGVEKGEEIYESAEE